MGTLAASVLINKASVALKDTTNVRWTRAELLDYLNEAQRALTSVAPEVTSTAAAVTTIPGVKQAIPSDGWLFLRATRNLGVGGTTPGRFLEDTSFDILTKNNPGWSADAATNTATAFMYTPLERTAFWIYPPADTSGNRIEVLYSRVPSTLTTETQAIDPPDTYESALLHYMLYRALAKDSEEGEPQKALAYLNSFTAQVGGAQTVSRTAPKEGESA